MRTTTRRLTGAFAALTLAAVPLLAQERTDANKVGIKVHGHWTIDVKKANGTLVSHNEFENALTYDGGVGIAQILGGLWTAGAWGVLLDGGVCQSSSLHPTSCLIMEPSAPVNGQILQDGTDLSVTVPPFGQTNAGFLVLKGSVRATTTGQITAVRTRQGACPAISSTVMVSPLACAQAITVFDTSFSNIFDVTSRTLATPIAVDAGQFIQVTVVLSFS
jgi:hypothetical protein